MQSDKARHELKFLINQRAYYILKERLRVLCGHDANIGGKGYYEVRSLYFDDYKKSGYFDKMNGTDKRRKYRARIYGTEDKKVKLEIKEKLGNMIRKSSSVITVDQYSNFLSNKSLSCKNAVEEEFLYKFTNGIIKPEVIIDYKREAFDFPFERTRITFDYDLYYGLGSQYDIYCNNVIKEKIFDEPYIILEVKYDDRLALFIKAIIQGESSHRLSVSKYALSMEKKGIYIWTE